LTNPTFSRLEADVLEELEAFVREARGARALARLHPGASLEKDLGLGSLERVELLSRLEGRLHRRAPERTLGDAQTPVDLARAFHSAPLETLGEEQPIAREPSRPRRTRAALEATNLCDVLVERARSEPDVPHIYLKEDDRPEETLTYSALYRDALRVAGALRRRGVGKGDRIAIMLPTSRGFFATFMGALFAGAVPVPLYPPFSLARIQEYARRQARILESAEAKIFVTVREGLAMGSLLKSFAPSLLEVAGVEELLDEPDGLESGRIEGSDPALIQYTSGSTGDPKGVLLGHDNLLANIHAIGKAVRIGPSDVGVSWLPLYHDMGLIGAWLTPLVFGIPVAIFSPLAFLSRPHRWLWTIHRRRGTISPAPNFAYELAARKIADPDVEGLDLSSWRVALNGAEPVLPRSLERFTRKFEKHGFRETSMLPVYGLAESSLLLSAPEVGSSVRIESIDRAFLEREGEARPPEAGQGEPVRLVSVGRVIEGHELAIVDERGEPIDERRVGRLLFRGPSAMKGYFRNAQATAAVVREDGFIDTGDRAFLAGGELFITGRIKDLIVKAGRNLIPQELEAAASEVSGVRGGSVVGFGVSDPALGTERIVLVAESKDESEESRARIASEIETAVADLTGIPPDEVLVVPPGTIPKTSSGKIRRSACREKYLEGELDRRARPSFAVLARIGWYAALGTVRRSLANAGRLAYGFYAIALAVSLVAPAWLLALLPVPRGFLRQIVCRASRLYLRLAGIPFEVLGREALAGAPGPFVFAANHSSYFDAVPVMAALDLDYAFVVKREAASWPIIGRAIRRLGHVPVERLSAEESVSATAVLRDELARGRSLVVFPEGTFTRADGIRPFKLGAFKLAADAGVPVVPLAIRGTRRVLRDKMLVPRRSPVRVEFLAPVAPRRESSFADIVEMKERVLDSIAERVGEPRLDLVAAGLEYP
jgi:1-acyl-sn-glycerol-3-phosphate acyltransferase